MSLVDWGAYTPSNAQCCSGKFTHLKGWFMGRKARLAENARMLAGMPVALAILAQASGAAPPAYGPAAPPKAAPAPPPSPDCAVQNATPKGNEIVICAPKPDGYRLPPDIVEARRLKKKGDSVRPRNPHETYADHSCANVGPMGCTGTPTINLLAVAAVGAEISRRLAQGKEVGSVFETTPQSSEYQLYLEAKKRREEKEADAAAKKTKAAAEAAQAPAKSQ
jgi:hypothetical protein